jgi:hypothetical protein
MAFEGQFGEEAWKKVVQGPFSATLAIVAADPGGLIGAVKEGGALTSIMRGDGAGGLVDEVAADIRSDRPAMRDVGIRRQSREQALSGAIAAMTDAVATVETHAPGEVDGYTQWLVGISERVAHAAREGGFLGIGGELVSDDEEAALAQIRSALGVS